MAGPLRGLRPVARREAEIEALLRLRPEPAGAAAARRFVTTTLTAWGCQNLVEATTLLVSEVVTNSILHARSDIELRVAQHGQGLRVEVRDSSQHQPTVRAIDEDASSGRGLAIVEMLATAWGVTHLPDGKVVWFEVAA